MQVLTAILFLLGLFSAVLIGPGSRAWTWSPALLFLAIAQIPNLVVLWKRREGVGLGVATLGFLTALWFALRALFSPVREFGETDGILLSAAIASFLCGVTIRGNTRAFTVFLWGISLLVITNVAFGFIQLTDPGFCLLVPRVPGTGITGLFTHYNEAANFFVAASSLLAGVAAFGRCAKWERWIFALVSLLGFTGAYLTLSRGGILAAAVALGTFSILIPVVGGFTKKKWFGASLVVVPLILILCGGGLFIFWKSALEKRGNSAGENVTQMMDNTVRLYLLGISFTTTSHHPWLGGGSRSFSWECLPEIKKESYADRVNRPELVHNETMQTATDYGITGLALLFATVLTILISAFSSLWKTRHDAARLDDAALIAGGVSALVGMFVQSCFSFVFHLMPGVLLLGVLCGLLSSRRRSGQTTAVAAKCVFSVSSLAAAVFLAVAGWKGVRLLVWLWPVYYPTAHSPDLADRARRLSYANRIWPSSVLLGEEAKEIQLLAERAPVSSGNPLIQKSAEKYYKASTFNPFDPFSVLNRANLLSLLGNDSVSESEFAKAIQLQGGLESGFRARECAAIHYHSKGVRLTREGRAADGLVSLEIAAELIEAAAANAYAPSKLADLRVSIHQSLGSARMNAGNPDGALESFAFISKLPGGGSGYYLSSQVLSRKAMDAWQKRRGPEAYRLFLEARRMASSSATLPAGVTEVIRKEFLAYLDKQIAFLKAAKMDTEE